MINNSSLKYIAAGSLLMFLAVSLGAFGAHGLKPILTTSQIETFQTGIQYHFIHAIAILVVANFSNLIPNSKLRITILFFIIGIILFSGSLYLLATRHLLGISDWKFLGPLTPIGGIFFLLAWSHLAVISLQEYRLRS